MGGGGQSKAQRSMESWPQGQQKQGHKARQQQPAVATHTCSTAAIASAVYSSANTLRNQPLSPPSSSPSPTGRGKKREC